MSSGQGVRGASTILASHNDVDDRNSTVTPIEEFPLIGTSWTAVEIALNEEPSAQQLLDRPITLSFESGRIHGSTGCNRYFGAFQQLSQNSFSTSNQFGLTRRYCGDAMEQERSYIRFVTDKTFYFQIVSAGENGDGDELVLLDNVNEPGQELALGEEVLAR